MTPSETRLLPDPDATAPPPGSNTPPRPGVRFAAGPQPSDPPDEELWVLLRRRLLVLWAISFCCISVLEWIVTPFQVNDAAWRPFISGWSLIVLTGGLTVVLWRWRSASLRVLRWLELIGFLALAGYLTQDLLSRLFEDRDLAVFHAA